MINQSQPAQAPLVSVIIPVFNRADTIITTLDSLKAQNYRPIEIIVVDDGSADESVKVVQDWIANNQSKKLRLFLIQQENKGAPAARNQGLMRARGSYLQFLDSDDTLMPEKIEAQVRILEDSGADVAICDFKYDYNNPIKDRVVVNDGDLLKKLVSGWSISVSSPLVSAELINGQLKWNEHLERQQDMDFIFKVMMLARKYVYTPGVWCNYVQHDGAQISDGYKFKAPQYGRRILSLILFMRLHNDLPKGRKWMVVKGMLNLVNQKVRYHAKGVLLSMFGEAAVRWIKKFA